jgi:hypothetical protein
MLWARIKLSIPSAGIREKATREREGGTKSDEQEDTCISTVFACAGKWQALPFVLTLLMYLTPILYFPDMLPAGLRIWLWLNPMSDWMLLIHAWLNGGVLPLESVARLLALWLLLLVPCWLWFRRTELHVRELL